ncbi:FF domain, putative [Babesia ovis]|uniref:FF domain, putative n=1 Tax=Babesia ovis TaxID=5869 RepID=A0A9W5TD49_BABOV|nr:FF domain, putative [Babesia ovis]
MGDIGVPVSWERLGDTKWYRVETSTKKVYFYNRASKESRWERPDVGVPEEQDVDGVPVPKEPAVSSSISEDDIAGYKSLIRELKLGAKATFEEVSHIWLNKSCQALPKLLFEDRFKRIPQQDRKRLFKQLQLELLKESSRKLAEIVHASRGDTTGSGTGNTTSSTDNSTIDVPTSNTDHTTTGVTTSSDNTTTGSGNNTTIGNEITRSNKRHQAYSAATRQRNNHCSSRDELALSMAQTAFISMLHEKIRMPFVEGEVAPLDEEAIQGDPRGESRYITARDRERLYKDYVKEFLETRLELFQQKLGTLGSEHLRSSLSEVIHILGERLFGELPRDRLKSVLRRWRDSMKKELLDSFDVLLRQTLCYAEGTEKENLDRAKKLLRDDPRYQRLASIREERDELVLRRIRELDDIHRKNRGDTRE